LARFLSSSFARGFPLGGLLLSASRSSCAHNARTRPSSGLTSISLCTGARRPGHAWQVGAWLEEHGVVDRDDRTMVLLQAQIDHAADPLWWTVLIEQLVPISAAPDTGFLVCAARRAAAQHEVCWLRQPFTIRRCSPC
jgi:hypothetical protein